MLRWAVLSIVLLVVCPAWADDNSGLAQRRFESGVTHYEKGELEQALAEFRASYELYASPNSRLYVARCLRGLGRTAEAVLAYELTIREAGDRAGSDPRYDETRSAAAKELAIEAPKVARLKLTVAGAPTEALQVTLDDKPVAAAALGMAIPVEPGEVKVRATAPGYTVAEGSIELRAKETGELHLALKRVPQPKPPPRQKREVSTGPSPWGWVAIGVGGLGFAGFGLFAGLAQKRFDDLAESCGEQPCPPDRQSDVDEGRTFEIVTNVSLAIGATSIAAGIIVLAATWNTKSEAAIVVGPRGVALRLTP